MIDVAQVAHRFPYRVKFIRPKTTGRTSSAALMTEETKGIGDTLHENVKSAVRYITGIEGQRAGQQLTQSRTQAHITCLQLLSDVRETDQCIVTDPAGGEQRFHIRAVGPRSEVALSFFRIERVSA